MVTNRVGVDSDSKNARLEKRLLAVKVGEDVMVRMIITKKIEWIRCLTWAMALISVHSVSADDEFVWSGPGCVLLKNGNVLSASDIVPQGKQIAIRLDKTGDVRIPSKDVVAIGRDKLELYHHQVSKTTRWEAGEHWQLAKWCLRQGLVEQSHIHYDQLKKLSGNHEKFKQLDSELRHSLLQDPVMKAALNSAFPREQVTSASHTETAQIDSSSLSKTGPTKVTPSSGVKQDSITSVANLNQNAQDYFRLHIQPFLAMRCGQAGCHGAYGRSDFHVAKAGVLHGQRSNDISLSSAVRFLDNENVEATKLWINATTSHGSQTTPSLTAKDSSERDLLNRLRLWHHAVAQSKATVTMSPMVQVAQAPSMPASANTSTSHNPAQTPAMAVGVTLPEIGDELLLLEKEIAKLEEKEQARKSTRRHDPEEFNRRFSKN